MYAQSYMHATHRHTCLHSPESRDRARTVTLNSEHLGCIAD